MLLSTGFLATLSLQLPAQNRVLFVSLDGLGYRNLTSDPAGQELTTLHRLAKAGVIAPLQTAFPSKTSAGHAALFTGAWAGVNGIYSNTNPRVPRTEYALRDTVSGFRSDTLTAEPIWTAAARQGLTTVAYQATQLYPFTERSAGKAVAVNGYQSASIAPARVITAADLTPAGAYVDGPLTFQIERRPNGLQITCQGNSLLVTPHEAETASPRNRLLARYFSKPLWLQTNGIHTGVYFRLFEFTPGGFLLYRTSAQQLAVTGNLGFDLEQEAGPFVPNAATGLYEKGRFGKTVTDGGDGTAERRFLETLELVVRQATNQTLALDRKLHPRLLVGYYPVIDDTEHTWFGLASTGNSSVDPYRAVAYATLDEGLLQIVKGFDTVVFASDHGMSGSTHEIRMPALLASLGFAADTLISNATCLFVNTADWKNGVVDPKKKAALLEEAEAKLAKTGLFTRFFHKQELDTRFGHGGDGRRSPDLCFDVKPGYYPVESKREPAIAAYPHPRGEHGFDPTRADMQSYIVASGRGIAANASPCLDCYRAIDLAASISAILGIQPPAQNQGKPIREVVAPR